MFRGRRRKELYDYRILSVAGTAAQSEVPLPFAMIRLSSSSAKNGGREGTQDTHWVDLDQKISPLDEVGTCRCRRTCCRQHANPLKLRDFRRLAMTGPCGLWKEDGAAQTRWPSCPHWSAGTKRFLRAGHSIESCNLHSSNRIDIDCIRFCRKQ